MRRITYPLRTGKNVQHRIHAYGPYLKLDHITDEAFGYDGPARDHLDEIWFAGVPRLIPIGEKRYLAEHLDDAVIFDPNGSLVRKPPDEWTAYVFAGTSNEHMIHVNDYRQCGVTDEHGRLIEYAITISRLQHQEVIRRAQARNKRRRS